MHIRGKCEDNLKNGCQQDKRDILKWSAELEFLKAMSLQLAFQNFGDSQGKHNKHVWLIHICTTTE